MWDLAKNVRGLGCLVEISEPAGHGETQGLGSMA